MNRTSREALGVLGALAIAIASAVAITWPLVFHVDEIILGGGELGGWLWRYDWHFRSLDGLLATELGAFDTWKEFVSLGRHPETGNVLDVLAFNYPLEKWFGFPASYNLKILLVLTLNGLCAYALGRYFSGSIAGALAAVPLAIANPICLQEIQASGLRQALLWWVLLYPPLLDRALRRRTLGAGLAAGLCLGLAGAYYWFYGLFTAMFTLAWVAKHLVVENKRVDAVGIGRGIAGVGVGVALGAGPFILPYALPEGQGAGGAAQLPEMTFFLPFPTYDTISHAPLRPQTYAENLLASINRTIGSSWSASYPFDPTLNESLPLVVLLVGILPAVLRRSHWGWLWIWLFFYVGTLGPFLRWGAGDSRDVVMLFDRYVIRLPYTWMFQFVPGMSRMFAPYRLGSFVVVASVALVALGVARTRWRAWVAPLVMLATVAQPLYHWGKGAVNEGGGDSRVFRSPIKANRIRVPAYYTELAKTERLSGIVELPLDQQQDLVYYYQVVHGLKVYRSWASPAAVPPSLRPLTAGGYLGEQLRYQARADNINGSVPKAFERISRDPETADLGAVTLDAVREWGESNKYERIILHERGYYLVDPQRGNSLYEVAARRLAEALGVPGEEYEELRKGDPANPEFGVPITGDLVPWTSQPMNLPPERAPAVYRMTVFTLSEAPATLDTAAGAVD
ncbi:MAG: hypothetical protein ACOZNI_01620 [Myxococcota bacterium]